MSNKDLVQKLTRKKEIKKAIFLIRKLKNFWKEKLNLSFWQKSIKINKEKLIYNFKSWQKEAFKLVQKLVNNFIFCKIKLIKKQNWFYKEDKIVNTHALTEKTQRFRWQNFKIN